MLVLLHARGDDEPLDAQAYLLIAQVDGHGRRGLVGHARATGGLAAFAG
ncbi:hypothetical protein [Streptomyces sediminimaris]